MKIGITGATGQLGRLVVDYAKKSTSPSNIVSLVRDPEKAKDLGVEVRAFDYNKPEALEAQLKGIDRLLLISGSEIGKRVQQHENVIKAANGALYDNSLQLSQLIGRKTTPLSAVVKEAI